MKKTLLITVALLAWGSMMQAQDTLRIRGPKDNYYSTSWFDTVGQHAYFSQWGFGPETDLLVKYFYTPDTLTVYGIAACVIPENYRREHRDEELLEYYGFDISTEPSDGYPPYYLQSSSYDSCYEYFRLYQATPSWWRPDSNCVLQPGQYVDSAFLELISHWGQTVPGNPIQKGEDLMIHVQNTPVSYYIDFHAYMDSEYPIPILSLPVYERYFNEPQQVADTFALGQTCHNYHRYWRTTVAMFTNETRQTPSELQGVHFNCPNGGWRYDRMSHFMSYIFPILTPEKDTGGGDSTLSVNDVEMLERYVNLLPNPASSSVQVASSYGLTRIEAYDAAGRKCYDRPATGLTATLDLTAWPKGTSILHIHTPAGTVTKKLLVR